MSQATDERHIYFVVFQNANYSHDIPRFFFKNRDIFAAHSILYPLINFEYQGTVSQYTFWRSCQGMCEARNDASTSESSLRYFQKTFESGLAEVECLDAGSGNLLFVLSAGHLEGLDLFLSQLRDARRFPGLGRARVHLVWLASSPDREMEGCYRRHYAGKGLDSSDFCPVFEAGYEKTIATARKIFDCFHGERSIIADVGSYEHHCQKILSALSIPVPYSECSSFVDTGLASRSLWSFFNEISEHLYQIYEEIADALGQFQNEFPDQTSFLSPLVLDAAYKSVPWMHKLFEKYGGCATPLPLPTDPGWAPFEGLSDQRFREILQKLLAILPARTRWRLQKRLAYTSLPERRGVRDLVTPSTVVSEQVPLFSVLTLTKNHELYIGKCIESVLEQQVDFPIEHIIVEEGSTDTTRRIISAYADRHDTIVPIFLAEGTPGGENVRALFSRAKSDYVALCDGDDYFIDPYKLQKQVDFLRTNPQCSLCFHPVQVVYEGETHRSHVYPPPELLPGGERSSYTLEDLIKGNFIQTNSVVYRWRFKQGLPDFFRLDLLPGDWYWHILHAELGAIGYINETMSAYRRHTQGLFYTAVNSSSISHRLTFGMKELELYDVINKQLNSRYSDVIDTMSFGVLSDFVKFYTQSDDDTYIQEAAEKFPEVTYRFLKSIDS